MNSSQEIVGVTIHPHEPSFGSVERVVKERDGPVCARFLCLGNWKPVWGVQLSGSLRSTFEIDGLAAD